MLFLLPHWLHRACVATVWIYGIVAMLHLIIEHIFAFGHRARIASQTRHAKRIRLEALRASTGWVRSHRQPWYEGIPVYKQHRTRILQAAKERADLEQSHRTHSIAVWVTVFQEDPDLLKKCLRALQAQIYPGRFKVFVVDDASYYGLIDKYRQDQPIRPNVFKRFWLVIRRRRPVMFLWRKPESYKDRWIHYLDKRRELEAVLNLFKKDNRFEIVMQDENGGKRDVQQVAWTKSHWILTLPDGGKVIMGYDLYGSVDSDTVCDPDAFALLERRFVNPDLGAATGYVDVENAKDNLLTRLVDMRYWNAFFVERAAQSFHRCVMCCSGPLALYRAAVVDQVMGQYSTQQFLKRFCTFGDDRHLTNQVLRKGYLVEMDHRAHCKTQVPTTIWGYIKQQIRWNKSFYREMLWTIKALRLHPWYMGYDLLNQFALPFMLVISLLATLVLGVGGGGWPILVQYVVTVLVLGLARSLYGAFSRKQPSFVLFMFYGFVYVFVLLPVRFYALWTLGQTHWGTRTA